VNLNQKASPLADLTDSEFQNAVEVFEILFRWDQEAKSSCKAAQIEVIEPDSGSTDPALYDRLTSLRSADES
jgi:hypothetical protein